MDKTENMIHDTLVLEYLEWKTSVFILMLGKGITEGELRRLTFEEWLNSPEYRCRFDIKRLKPVPFKDVDFFKNMWCYHPFHMWFNYM